MTSMSSSAPNIAVVVPVFNEEAVLPELFSRLRALFEANGDCHWRAVLVDDGSRDRSVELVRAASREDPRFELVELSRNFGFQGALAAGLARARSADAAVTMDADLQDPPEVIPALVDAWRKGADVVRAVRNSRQETGLRRLLGRPAIEAFHLLPERHRFFPGLRAWIGFTTADVVYDRQERAAGKPQQTFRRLVRYAFDGLFSFSYLPLRLLTYTGMFVSGLGFALGLFFIVKRLLGIETAGTGFTTLVSVVTFLGGIQLMGIGVLGEYLGRIYDEVKQRPVYLVKPPPR